MKHENFYFVDLKRKELDISYDSRKDVFEDMEYFKLKSPYDFETFDLRMFDTAEDAQKFLIKYQSVLDGLDNFFICKQKDIPCLLSKRRHIVLSLLKIKNKTRRSYLKDWNVGQLVNLTDQTYFLTVKITKIKKISETQYEYSYKLA